MGAPGPGPFPRPGFPVFWNPIAPADQSFQPPFGQSRSPAFWSGPGPGQPPPPPPLNPCAGSSSITVFIAAVQGCLTIDCTPDPDTPTTFGLECVGGGGSWSGSIVMEPPDWPIPPGSRYEFQCTVTAEGSNFRVMVGLVFPLATVPFYEGLVTCNEVTFANNIYVCPDPFEPSGCDPFFGNGGCMISA